MICFHFSIFEPLETAIRHRIASLKRLWFAFILVSLNHWKQQYQTLHWLLLVVICFHFSIFEPLETAGSRFCNRCIELWFAFILVSLNHWKQPVTSAFRTEAVVICFHFSIFEPLETADKEYQKEIDRLWFAFILVSLNHWKQRKVRTFLSQLRCDLLSF